MMAFDTEPLDETPPAAGVKISKNKVKKIKNPKKIN